MTDSHSDLQNPTTPSTPNSNTGNNQFNLQFLCSLIPKSFDGNRAEFNEFYTNCVNAMSLANNDQTYPLLVFIVSKLTGKVRTQLQGKSYKNWSDLKAILDKLYQDQKHYIQLMEELNTLKQNSNESVSYFYERLDRLVTRVINSITYKNIDEQKIKIETIQELALSRFIHHTVPDISRFLRSQNVTDISEALSKSLAEERALKISHNEFRQTSRQQSHCTECNRNGHTSKSCFRTKSAVVTHKNILLNQSSSPSNTNSLSSKYTDKFCRYCKKQGHFIHECRKREYADKKRARNQNHNSDHTTTNPTNVHLNYPVPQLNAEPAEINIHKA